ncbi:MULTISPECIES: GNAT family N-acetyltransferase [Mesorhizobium]|uniref:GNAT family N-acetyltransferase n=1 Tax=Mesorhizobium TaxID=68287 RepID=UPI0003CEDA1A|nr:MULTISPECIES: GNAT family N-acetyltransferase [Mesorhizobium]ESY68937.1 acetyltransferase [Mesorhizobium sp. LNHC232B00]WJI40594.1 GNAT family N-acetyltransferase [Mesorhizobium opportunistum]
MEQALRTEVVIRDGQFCDAELLWDFLAIAADEANAVAAKNVPVVACHLEEWLRPGDFGVIAEHEGVPIGAAWARQFSLSENPVCYASDRTPEVSIGVISELRGLGVGLKLLQCLEVKARRLRLDGLCLNVRDTNPALKLYERAGYRRIDGARFANRIGGLSIWMLLQLR